MEICSSHRCAVVQHQCSARVLLAKHSCPLLTAAVQNRLTAGLCCCKHTFGDLLLTQECSGPTPVTLLLAKYSCPLLSAAVQNRLIAGLCCCKYIYGDLLFPQVCSGSTPVRSHSAYGKMQLPPAQCCCAKQAERSLVLLQIHLWRFALDTGVQWSNTSAVPECFWQSTVAPCSLLLCKTG